MTKNLNTAELLDRLPGGDIAALYYGTYHILRDLQDLQISGRRIPGGLSGRIELASVHCMIFNDELRNLAERNPAKLREILDYFRLSSNLHIKATVNELEEVLRRVETGQGESPR